MTIFFLNVLCFVIITDSYIIATNLVVFLSLCGTIGKIDRCKRVADEHNIHKHIVILFLFLSSSIARNVSLVFSSFHCQEWYVGSGYWPLVWLIVFFLSPINFLMITFDQVWLNDKALVVMEIFNKDIMHW